jgi:hypothetical protein
MFFQLECPFILIHHNLTKMNKNQCNVLQTFVLMQKRRDLSHHLNTYYTADDLYSIHWSINKDQSMTKRSYQHALNYILHLGIIKQYKLELFKRTRKVKPDDGTTRLKNVTEFFISSPLPPPLRRSNRLSPPSTKDNKSLLVSDSNNLITNNDLIINARRPTPPSTLSPTPPPPLRRSNRLSPQCTKDNKSLLVSDSNNLITNNDLIINASRPTPPPPPLRRSNRLSPQCTQDNKSLFVADSNNNLTTNNDIIINTNNQDNDKVNHHTTTTTIQNNQYDEQQNENHPSSRKRKHTPLQLPFNPQLVPSPSSQSSSSCQFDNPTQAYIDSALDLDFDLRPRPNLRLCGTTPSFVPIQSDQTRVVVAESTKWLMVATVSDMGISRITKKNKIQLCKAVVYLESYYCGYSKPVTKPNTLLNWYYSFLKAKKTRVGADVANVFALKHERANYILDVDAAYPGFLHKLYRTATNLQGHDAPMATIYHRMNMEARRLFPNCDIRSNLKLNKFHFTKWFFSNGGKFRKYTTKPTLTAQQRKDRLVWAQDMKENIKDKDFHFCFLDEKWFYVHSKRSVYKILPPGPGESVEDAFVRHPKEHSRRFPIKAMFMGVVAPPNLDEDFDGTIMLERISKFKTTKQRSYSQRFVDNHQLNESIKNGLWRTECYDTISVAELALSLQEKYAMDHTVTRRLCASYSTYSGKSKSKKWVRLTGNDFVTKNNMIMTEVRGTLRPLTLEDVHLHVQVPAGSLIEEDCTCDSDFMLDIIREVGSNIRKSFNWVAADTIIHLFMDNAGGHGTNKARNEYVQILYNDYKVQVIWQIANSPETNMLDLGAWVTVQCIVAHMHRGKRVQKDVLCKTVYHAFFSLQPNKLENIAQRWKRVLDLIIVGKGSNDLVEKCRGLTSSLADLPNLEYDDVE